jgi:hypothetical protein
MADARRQIGSSDYLVGCLFAADQSGRYWEKIVAVVNGEIHSLQDFEDRLALTTIYQLDWSDADRPQSVHRFVD